MYEEKLDIDYNGSVRSRFMAKNLASESFVLVTPFGYYRARTIDDLNKQCEEILEDSSIPKQYFFHAGMGHDQRFKNTSPNPDLAQQASKGLAQVAEANWDLLGLDKRKPDLKHEYYNLLTPGLPAERVHHEYLANQGELYDKNNIDMYYVPAAITRIPFFLHNWSAYARLSDNLSYKLDQLKDIANAKPKPNANANLANFQQTYRSAKKNYNLSLRYFKPRYLVGQLFYILQKKYFTTSWQDNKLSFEKKSKSIFAKFDLNKIIPMFFIWLGIVIGSLIQLAINLLKIVIMPITDLLAYKELSSPKKVFASDNGIFLFKKIARLFLCITFIMVGVYLMPLNIIPSIVLFTFAFLTLVSIFFKREYPYNELSIMSQYSKRLGFGVWNSCKTARDRTGKDDQEFSILMQKTVLESGGIILLKDEQRTATITQQIKTIEEQLESGGIILLKDEKRPETIKKQIANIEKEAKNGKKAEDLEALKALEVCHKINNGQKLLTKEEVAVYKNVFSIDALGKTLKEFGRIDINSQIEANIDNNFKALISIGQAPAFKQNGPLANFEAGKSKTGKTKFRRIIFFVAAIMISFSVSSLAFGLSVMANATAWGLLASALILCVVAQRLYETKSNAKITELEHINDFSNPDKTRAPNNTYNGEEQKYGEQQNYVPKTLKQKWMFHFGLPADADDVTIMAPAYLPEEMYMQFVQYPEKFTCKSPSHFAPKNLKQVEQLRDDIKQRLPHDENKYNHLKEILEKAEDIVKKKGTNFDDLIIEINDEEKKLMENTKSAQLMPKISLEVDTFYGKDNAYSLDIQKAIRKMKANEGINDWEKHFGEIRLVVKYLVENQKLDSIEKILNNKKLDPQLKKYFADFVRDTSLGIAYKNKDSRVPNSKIIAMADYFLKFGDLEGFPSKYQFTDGSPYFFISKDKPPYNIRKDGGMDFVRNLAFAQKDVFHKINIEKYELDFKYAAEYISENEKPCLDQYDTDIKNMIAKHLLFKYEVKETGADSKRTAHSVSFSSIRPESVRSVGPASRPESSAEAPLQKFHARVYGENYNQFICRLINENNDDITVNIGKESLTDETIGAIQGKYSNSENFSIQIEAEKPYFIKPYFMLNSQKRKTLNFVKALRIKNLVEKYSTASTKSTIQGAIKNNDVATLKSFMRNAPINQNDIAKYKEFFTGSTPQSGPNPKITPSDDGRQSLPSEILDSCSSTNSSRKSFSSTTSSRKSFSYSDNEYEARDSDSNYDSCNEEHSDDASDSGNIYGSFEERHGRTHSRTNSRVAFINHEDKHDNTP